MADKPHFFISRAGEDAEYAKWMAGVLEDEGYTVDDVGSGEDAIEHFTAEPSELALIDLMLPGKNGLEVCRELRQRGNDTAILMLTAKSQLTDRVVGLKLGADDYVTKPFAPPELLARIEALIRRVHKEKLMPVARFAFGNVEVNFRESSATKDGQAVSLAGKEMELLRYLIDHRGNVVSREELLEGVWAYQPGVSSRTIDVHVAWLRQKLEDNPSSPRHIHTVRGVGYRFAV